MACAHDGDVIAVYACSYPVQRILINAHAKGKSFQVIVVDSHPKYEGKTILKNLISGKSKSDKNKSQNSFKTELFDSKIGEMRFKVERLAVLFDIVKFHNLFETLKMVEKEMMNQASQLCQIHPEELRRIERVINDEKRLNMMKEMARNEQEERNLKIQAILKRRK